MHIHKFQVGLFQNNPFLFLVTKYFFSTVKWIANMIFTLSVYFAISCTNVAILFKRVQREIAVKTQKVENVMKVLMINGAVRY